MANPNLELKISIKWRIYPCMYLYGLWCKLWGIVPKIEDNQFFRSCIVISPERKI